MALETGSIFALLLIVAVALLLSSAVLDIQQALVAKTDTRSIKVSHVEIK